MGLKVIHNDDNAVHTKVLGSFDRQDYLLLAVSHWVSVSLQWLNKLLQDCSECIYILKREGSLCVNYFHWYHIS